jgi:DNA-binding NtrC family response regulator
MAAAATEVNGVKTLEEVEREHILATLRQFKGHRQATAAALGIGRRTLGMKLALWKRQGIDVPEGWGCAHGMWAAFLEEMKQKGSVG